MTKPLKAEELEQIRLVGWLQTLKLQKKIITFYATVNENNQSSTNKQMAIRIGQKAKKMGKRAGVSDITVITKTKVIYVEMKRKKKKLQSGKLSASGISVSDSQIEFLEDVNSSNVCVGTIAYGYDEAREFIEFEILER